MKTHEEIQDLLEGYVDETLDRDTYREVDEHLATCEECQAILDAVAPVDLSGLSGGAVDERALRRSVRRAMRRTVLDAALTLLALVAAVWLIGVLIVQPLIVNRGGRAAAAARATYDLAVMLNEGATISGFSIDSTAFQRVFTVDLALPLGSGSLDLGSVSSRIGMLGFGDAQGGSLRAYAESRDVGGDAQERLARLGPGTVATVALRFDEPLAVERAQQLADSTAHDVRVVWAGFPVDDTEERGGEAFASGSIVGYATCLGPQTLDEGFFGATSADGGGHSTAFAPSSIDGALNEVRRAVRNLVEHPEPAGALPNREAGAPVRLEAALAHLSQSDPGVVSLVVTGPTSEILGFADHVQPTWTAVLAVDLYNWSVPVCGR